MFSDPNWVEEENARWDRTGLDGMLSGAVSSKQGHMVPLAVTYYPFQGHFGEYPFQCL